MRRLSPATLTIGMLGVVGLLVAAYVGKKLLARDVPPPSDPLISVPMALTDLEPGTRVTEAHLAMGPSRESKLTRDIVRATRVVAGRVVKNKITAAQPISTYDLYAPGETPPLSLEPGMVAVTIPLSTSVAARPGQYVNVHFTPTNDPNQEVTGGRIITLFKGVKILSMSASGVNRSSADVTLELTPEQSNVILLAKDQGTLNLVYTPEGKGSGDVAGNADDRATLYEILGYTPKDPEEPVPPYQTHLFSGGGRSVNRFQDGVPLDDTGRNYFGSGGNSSSGSNGSRSRSGGASNGDANGGSSAAPPEGGQNDAPRGPQARLPLPRQQAG